MSTQSRELTLAKKFYLKCIAVHEMVHLLERNPSALRELMDTHMQRESCIEMS